jgi:hypothetical protein
MARVASPWWGGGHGDRFRLAGGWQGRGVARRLMKAVSTRDCSRAKRGPKAGVLAKKLAPESRWPAPEGPLIIAQRFSAGSTGREEPICPGGTTEKQTSKQGFNRPSGTKNLPVSSVLPALKCWATVNRPSGTENCTQLACNSEAFHAGCDGLLFDFEARPLFMIT